MNGWRPRCGGMSRPTIARPLRLLPCRRARSSACRSRPMGPEIVSARRPETRHRPARRSDHGLPVLRATQTATMRPAGWRRSRRRPARLGSERACGALHGRRPAESRPGRCCRGRSSIPATRDRRCRARSMATRRRLGGDCRHGDRLRTFRSCRILVGKPPGSTPCRRRRHARPRGRLPRRQRRAGAPSRPVSGRDRVRFELARAGLREENVRRHARSTPNSKGRMRFMVSPC